MDSQGDIDGREKSLCHYLGRYQSEELWTKVKKTDFVKNLRYLMQF